MEENIEIIEQENIVKTGYILFSTIEEYNAVNIAISTAMGFPDSKEATERYSSLNPMQDTDDKFVMEISASVQELYPNTITGYELVDSVNYKQIEEL